MAEIFVREGGAWVTPSAVRVNSGMLDAAEGYARVGGRWEKFWPQRAAPTVSTFNATITKSWRDNWGWRDDTSKPELAGGYNDRVYQGEWTDPPPYGNHRGYWFYDYAAIQSVLQADGGRKITKIEIRLQRREINGYWRPEGLYFWTHKLAAPPGGKPGLLAGPAYAGDIDRGEVGWFDLPLSFGRALRDDDARGFALYRSQRGPYLILDGLTAMPDSGQLRITHE